MYVYCLSRICYFHCGSLHISRITQTKEQQWIDIYIYILPIYIIYLQCICMYACMCIFDNLHYWLELSPRFCVVALAVGCLAVVRMWIVGSRARTFSNVWNCLVVPSTAMCFFNDARVRCLFEISCCAWRLRCFLYVVTCDARTRCLDVMFELVTRREIIFEYMSWNRSDAMLQLATRRKPTCWATRRSRSVPALLKMLKCLKLSCWQRFVFSMMP